MMKWLICAMAIWPLMIQAQDKKDGANNETTEKWDTTVIRQFDGTRLHVVCNENTWVPYCETSDGYTIVLDKIGMYEYAKKGRGGDLVPSGNPAKDEDQRTGKDKSAVRGLQKHLRYSGAKLEALLEKEKKTQDDPAIIKRYKKRKP